MDEQIDASEATKTVVNCESVVDINSADKLYQRLHDALQYKHVVEINATDVTRVDTAILQLFTAFTLEAKIQELSVSWLGVSEAFYQAVELLGLTDELNIPQPQ